MKICSKCKLEKESSEFYARMAKCKECHKQVTRNWQLRNPERMRKIAKDWYHRTPENRQYSIDKAREWQATHKDRDNQRKFAYNLKRNYGLSYETYCEMELKQDGKCAICNKPPYRNLDVDHNHETGKIRKLLCSNCNTALGLLKDDTELFTKAIEYLKSF